MALPTIEEIAARYGVDPDDTGCGGYQSTPPPDAKKTSAQVIATKVKTKKK